MNSGPSPAFHQDLAIPVGTVVLEASRMAARPLFAVKIACRLPFLSAISKTDVSFDEVAKSLRDHMRGGGAGAGRLAVKDQERNAFRRNKNKGNPKKNGPFWGLKRSLRAQDQQEKRPDLESFGVKQKEALTRFCGVSTLTTLN